MTNKIQQLTEKIYDEGIAKAKAEATNIIAHAQKQAEQIIEAAQSKEALILKKAQKATNEKMQFAEAEIHIVTPHALNNLKQQINRLINTKQVQPALNHTFTNGKFAPISNVKVY